MASKTPSFVRDPDQAAELAALLQDTAVELESDLNDNRRAATLNGRQLVQAEQTIDRYRRWAAELTPAQAVSLDDEGQLHIRPVPFGERDEDAEATG